MYGEEIKYFDYQGIVIGSTGPDQQEFETDLVLLLQSERDREGQRMRVYGVSKNAFVPPEVEKNFENIEIAKNLERRYATPLLFGDLIQWNERDCDHAKNRINRFGREKSIYQVSSCSSGPTIRVGGAIEPRNMTTFWNPLHTVSIGADQAYRAEPNVWLYAWIKVETTMRSSSDPVNVTFSFHEFDSCDVSDQGRVSEAPWHKGSLDSRFAMWRAEPTPAESDDEIDLAPRKGVYIVENKWAETIKKQLGLYVGDRLIICKELSQYDFIIPLLMPIAIASAPEGTTKIDPAIGEYFHFSAVWSNHHNAFLVTNLLPFQVLRSHYTTTNGNIFVNVIPAEEDGFFIDEQHSLGLIDDPHHVLSLRKFHPASYQALKMLVEIRAVRASENRSVRYRIIKIIDEDRHLVTYESWLKTERVTVSDCIGVVINKDTVISTKHPNVYFRLAEAYGGKKNPVSVGCGVEIRATKNPGAKNEVQVTNITLKPEYSIQKVVGDETNRIFQVKLTAVPGYEQLAKSENFGYVDMRDHRIPPEAASGKPFLAWVRVSQAVGDCRIACTIFEVYSLALSVPKLPAPAPKTGRNSVFSHRSSSSSTQVYSRGSETGGSSQSSKSSRTSGISSVRTHRFIGPGARSSASSSRHSDSSAASSTK